MILRTVCLVLVVALGARRGTPQPAGAADAPDRPFTVEASAGPQAGSRIDARVTRTVDGARVTLPGAVVPALEPGDAVDIRFNDYSRPPALANYHTNVAFITEAAPQRWLYERSGPWDRLFTSAAARTRRGSHAAAPPAPGLHFVYGTPGHRGIPIVFIVPEDGKTRGMDGVRDYVAAHPTDFKDMAQSANDAADRYVWFHDFLASLANGSIDPVSARQRVETVAASLGANPASVDACYSAGGTSASVADCIKFQLDAVNYQTNIAAPTQAQFFGGAVGAAAPVAIAAYLVPLLSVWKLFVTTGHREFEYLPTTLAIAGGPGDAVERQLLMGLKVPSLRPPAAYSDALFFTIGDPQAAASPPTVVNTSDATGVCAPAARLQLPLHLDRTSTYVHDTRAIVTPDGGAPYAIPIDPRSVDNPTLDAGALRGAGDGAYSVQLAGRFGFAPIGQPAIAEARVAIPHAGRWTVATLPHRRAIAGQSLDFIAASPSAPCVTRAELQIGDQPPIPLDLKRLSDRRLSLHAALTDVPPGDAHLRFYQADRIHDADIESDVAVAIEARPAHVDPAKPPIAYLGDRSIDVTGTELETAAALRLGHDLYTKDAGSTAGEACFSGPPIDGPGLEPGQTISATFTSRDGSPGQVFAATLAAPRPALRAVTVAPQRATYFSTEPLAVTLEFTGDVPSRREVRVRRAGAPTACGALRADPAADGVLPPGALYQRSATSLTATLDAAAVLNDRAFGPLQVQVVDTGKRSASDWIALPGTFVRAPRINKIACPADPAAACALMGTGLSAIAAISDDSGATLPLGPACTPDEKIVACLTIPRRKHYLLTLADDRTAMPVSDSLIVTSGGTRPGSPSGLPAPQPSAPQSATPEPAAPQEPMAAPSRPQGPTPSAPSPMLEPQQPNHQRYLASNSASSAWKLSTSRNER